MFASNLTFYCVWATFIGGKSLFDVKRLIHFDCCSQKGKKVLLRANVTTTLTSCAGILKVISAKTFSNTQIKISVWRAEKQNEFGMCLLHS